MSKKSFAQKKIKLVVLFIASFLVCFLVAQNLVRGFSEESVILGDRGFSQQSITINRGTTVSWKIEGKNPHWPASNFHPTHGEYPESGGCGGSKLDACREMKNGEEYKFTFNKAGTWGMHDHLYSAYTMNVTVVDNGASSGLMDKIGSFFQEKLTSANKDAGLLANQQYSEKELPERLKKKCMSPEVQDDFACFARELEAITIKNGRDYAVKILFALQKIEPRAQNCHFLAHGIGWGTYKRDPENYQESIANSSPLCSYGEQMGIIEKYVGSLPNGNLSKKDIPDICGKDPKSDCNHAVGHMVLVYVNGEYDKAVEYCSEIQDKLQRGYCFSGVMMEKFVEGNLREHGLKPKDKSNWPLKLWEHEQFCRTLTGELEMECWREIVHPAFFYFDKDPKAMFDFCQTAPREEIRRACKIHSIPEVAGDKGHELESTRGMCTLERDRDPGFEQECYLHLIAMRTNFIDTEESKDVIPFCAELDPQLQSICFRAAGPRLISNGIEKNVLEDLCKKVPSEYEGYCNGSVREAPVNVHQ